MLIHHPRGRRNTSTSWQCLTDCGSHVLECIFLSVSALPQSQSSPAVLQRVAIEGKFAHINRTKQQVPFTEAHLFLPSALCGLCQRFYPCQNRYLCQAAFPALSSAKHEFGCGSRD